MIRNLRHRYGTYEKISEVTGISVGSLASVGCGRGGSMMMAVRLTRLAGIPIETVSEGRVLSTDRCTHCGQNLPEKTP